MKLIIVTMTHCIKFGTHTWFQIKIIPVTFWDIVFLSLTLFGFVFLYYLFCDVFPDMLTCLFCILFEFFQRSKPQKYNQLELSILLSLVKNYLNCHGTRHAPSNFYIPSLSSTYFS